MDKYITIEIYTSDNYLQIVNMPVRNKGVEATIKSAVEFIHESLLDKERLFISFVGKYESVTIRKDDINKILINGNGVEL